MEGEKRKVLDGKERERYKEEKGGTIEGGGGNGSLESYFTTETDGTQSLAGVNHLQVAMTFMTCLNLRLVRDNILNKMLSYRRETALQCAL